MRVSTRLSDLEAVGNADSEARALALGLPADCSTETIYQQESSEAPPTGERASEPDGLDANLCSQA